MYLIDKVSSNIGKRISKQLNLDKDKEEIITYGAFALLQTLWSIFLVILLGYFCNVLLEALIISVTVSFLRKYSGGVHASSPNRCAVIGAVISVLLAFLGKSMSLAFDIKVTFIIEVILAVLSYIIIFKLAPVDSAAKRIKSNEKRRKLKRKALFLNSLLFSLVLLMNYFYYMYGNIKYLNYSYDIVLGILWQVITLTPIGFFILGKLDNIISIKGGDKNEEIISK